MKHLRRRTSYDRHMTCCNGPRNAPEFDPDDEGPSDADLERFGGATRACPDCKTDVYDEASICPRCGSYLDDRPLGANRMKTRIFTAALIVAGIAILLIYAL